MSGQALDLRRSAQIVWRYRALVGVLASLGLLAGVAYTVFNPPTYTSSALVVVSPSVNVATQVVVVTSDPVLSGALRSVDPHMSVGTLNSRVHATRMTSQVMSVSAQGTSAAQAEETANAVTSSYIAYVSSASSPIGQVPTRLLQPAMGAVKAPLTGRLLGTAGLGVLLGALIGAVIALAISRSDRRLRQRDEIADCIGVPVLLSVAVGHPSDAAGWTGRSFSRTTSPELSMPGACVRLFTSWDLSASMPRTSGQITVPRLRCSRSPLIGRPSLSVLSWLPSPRIWEFPPLLWSARNKTQTPGPRYAPRAPGNPHYPGDRVICGLR